MGYLLSISVPNEFKDRVSTFCKERQYTPGSLAVTLIEPSLLQKVSGLEQKLQSFCLMQADFNLVIGGPSNYNNQLLYLNVLPGFISLMRSKLVDYLKLPSNNKVYKPHLTLMRSQPGREIDMNRMLQEAQAYFPSPYAFTVSSIELFSQQHENSPYKPHSTIHFTGR